MTYLYKIASLMSLLYNFNSSVLPRVCVGGGECQKYVITKLNTTDIIYSRYFIECVCRKSSLELELQRVVGMSVCNNCARVRVDLSTLIWDEY